MPYIFEVVNVTTYIWLYMNINVLDYSTWNSNHLMHPMCEYIYAHVYMSMHSLLWCDISRIAVHIIWSRYIFQCVVNSFLFSQEEQHALLLRMLTVSLKIVFFFLFLFPFPEWISVQSASTEYCLIFDNHFLFSETLITNSICTVWWNCNTI